MADNPLQAESVSANPDVRSIGRMACDDFDGIGVHIEQAGALVNLMADVDSIDARTRNALVAVSDLLDFRATVVRETVDTYLDLSRVPVDMVRANETAPPDAGGIAWQAGRDFETLAGQIEDAAALVSLLAQADSIDEPERNALGAVSDLLDFIRVAVSKYEAKFDATSEAARAADGKVAKFKRRATADKPNTLQ